MNIAILLPDAELGGAQKVLIGLADEFSKCNSLQFIYLVQSGTLQTSMQESTKRTYLSENSSLSSFSLIVAFYKLVGFMRSTPNLKVISSGTGTNLLACAARLFAPKGMSLVIREACSSRNSNSWIIALLKRLLYPRADGMIGVSVGVAKELKELAGKHQPVASIPNPVDIVRLHALVEAQDERLSAFSHPYLLTVGRLVSQKNTTLLIDAYAEIADSVAEHLVIIGAGPLEAELRQRIAQHGLASKIHLLGEIANPHPWYKRASVFVLSSDSEGYPNVLVEALAHGLPVVSTDCDFGPRQILEDGRYGKLVMVGDLLALSDAIKVSLSNAGVTDVWDAERFSDSVVASQYLIFMETCSNG